MLEPQPGAQGHRRRKQTGSQVAPVPRKGEGSSTHPTRSTLTGAPNEITPEERLCKLLRGKKIGALALFSHFKAKAQLLLETYTHSHKITLAAKHIVYQNL